MEKKKYYVSPQSKEISQVQYHNNDAFTVYATRQEIEMLRMKLHQIEDAESDSFWRAHIPIKPYHDDIPNDKHDKNLADAYSMIFELGDDEARNFIEETGMLDHRPIDIDIEDRK